MKPLSDLTKTELVNLERNALRLLQSGDDTRKAEANALLERVSAEKERRVMTTVATQSGLVWDNAYQGRRVAYLNGVAIVEIRQDENHNSENNEVYSVFVRGVRYPKRFRYISDAREEIESLNLE